MKLGSSIVNALNNISSKYHYDCGDHGCKGRSRCLVASDVGDYCICWG